jgi:hypothetical protein
MSNAAPSLTSSRILEPIERISEVLFGLIMVLTFTGSLSAAESGRAEVRTMLIGAIGCNLAWGIIDAIMYLMNRLSDRAADRHIILAIRRAPSAEAARQVIARALPPVVESALTQSELQRICDEVARNPIASQRASLEGRDWLGALAVFLFVFVATIPVVLPFVFLQNAMVALRVSNVIAIVMMFAVGYLFGRVAGYRPMVTGGSMVLLGSVLVAITIALGG